jgi:hypothetical protein
MDSLQAAAWSGGLAALTLLIYSAVQFSDPGPGAEDLLRGFLGLGLGLIAIAVSALGVALRSLVE